MDSLPEKKEKEEGSSSYSLPHPVWTKEELENVTITHNVPQTKVDKVRREREGGEGGEMGGEGGMGGKGRGRGRKRVIERGKGRRNR